MADQREPLLRRLGAAGAARNARSELVRRAEEARRTESTIDRITAKQPPKRT